ncbi:hypothetical protein DFH27DRAFT_265144 [Peziza echinospora]|nr:hypothetical protein DFH27DRAFT_265144 [Peziza echinospora]
MFWKHIITLATTVFITQTFARRIHRDPPEEFLTCLAARNNSGVEIIQPTSPSWSQAIEPYNLRLHYVPLVLIVPETARQVAAAVDCARRHKIKVQSRSGGHSYGAMGLGGKNGSLVIDLKKFNSIAVDGETVTVGPGVRLGNLAIALFENGKRAMPHGICPGVGVGGHALHGGFGLTSRMWGTTLDNILEMEVVLADGSIVLASEKKNADLFWALRGAGSSYGIVTSFKFQTYPAPEVSTMYQIAYSAQNLTIATRTEIIMAMQKYGATLAAPEMSVRIFFADGYHVVSGVYWGDREGYVKAIAPLLELLPKTNRQVIMDGVEKDWLTTLDELDAGVGLKQPLDGYDSHETFFTKSLVTPADDLLQNATVKNLFTFLDAAGRRPPAGWWIIFDLYGGVGSKITSVSANATAYAHRNALFTLQLYTGPPNFGPVYPAEGFAFANGISESITKFQNETRFNAYANYVDPTLTKEEAWDLYYGGGERLEKLNRIKDSVDPERVFWNPQAIRA